MMIAIWWGRFSLSISSMDYGDSLPHLPLKASLPCLAQADGTMRVRGYSQKEHNFIAINYSYHIGY
jgi:hypothetical protein